MNAFLRLTGAFLVVAWIGCAGQPDRTSPPAESGAPPAAEATSIASVIDALRAGGVLAKAAGTLQQPFFSPPAHVFSVDGGDLQLYEFASAADAASAAAQVSPNGGSIGTRSMAWMAAPHFYRRGRVIAIYLGASAKVTSELERILGPPFAGRA